MSKISLRAAFTLANETPVTAQQVFTDRIAEVDAFDRSLEALGASLAGAAISPVTDRGAPRRNVLTYYGVGGIGKTTLSEELERRFVAAPETGKSHDRAAVRFDFAEAASFDLESYVLRLRAGLGHLSRRWPAFDVAFSLYWSRAHPGEPLDDFITRDSALRHTARDVRLTEQIVETLNEALGAALPGVLRAARIVGELTYRHVRKAVSEHRMLRQCELLADLIEADADVETLSYFPYLLAWDLDRLDPPGPSAMVLLDTFEEVTARGTREMERWLQRSVYLMPNVLWVITGRNRLDWADLEHATELDYVGDRRWPLLKAGQNGEEPRQHLVGYLSGSDAGQYLTSALTSNGQPAIPEEIRDRIVAASGGLPLYLDLAVTLYLDLLARGENPEAGDFGQPLPAVCGRILRDLDRDERALMRAAALLDSFDAGMLRMACPSVPDSALARFLDRSFLELDPDRVWPYSLHAILREAMREADRDLRDSWSERERAAAAERISGYLEHAASKAADAGDRSAQAAAVRQAIDLSLRTGQFPDWLTSGAQSLLASGGWTVVPDLPAEASGPAAALVTGLKAARERRSGNLDESVRLLDAAAATPDLPAALSRFLLLHKANALRVAGRYADGAAEYQRLWDTPGDFRDDAGYWLADYAFLQGRFADALAGLDQLADAPPDLRGEILRLKGHIYRVNALSDQAEDSYRKALDLARESANLAAEGKALTDLVQAISWIRPGEALELRDRAAEVNESLRNKVELVKIHAAAAVALTGQGDVDGAREQISQGLALSGECGYPGGQVWCQTASVLALLRADDPAAAGDTAGELERIVSDLRGNRFWSQIAYWWIGDDNAHWPAGTTAWLEGDDDTRSRWLRIAAVLTSGGHH